MSDTAAIILAAGKGIRMNSDLPKVYHSICGKPLIAWVVEAVQKAGSGGNVYVVVGYKAELVKEACEKYQVNFVEQKEQLGTGHAVMQVGSLLKDLTGTTVVLNGDVPLIKPKTIKDLVAFHEKMGSAATVLTADLDDPGAYGRIVRDGSGGLVRIIEKKDAGKDELAVKEINTGTYCFNNQDLFNALPKLKSDNAQKEYYLTDVIGILKSSGRTVCAFKAADATEVLGVNTKEDLLHLEELCKRGV
ncbi:NTP transferase domain-containing protein [Candidatus Margulisiibacteriota bacterium]